MTTAEDYMKRYEENQQMFADLFNTPSKDIVEGLKKHLAHDSGCMGVLSYNPTVVKTYENDEPNKIQIYFYNQIEITVFGISYIPEHGRTRQVLTLTKDFKL